MSVQSEITRIESAKTAIATAIAGKGVTVPEGTKLDGMAALVESIEAGSGDVALGEITITSNENVTLTDAFPVRSQAPKAYFWFEKGLSLNDTTHTKRRPIALICVRREGGTGSDTSGRYAGAYIQTSSGSNAYSADYVSASNLFNTSCASVSSTYSIFTGNYKTGTLYFGVNSTTNGFIEGRTYVWGVIPWDE